MKKGTLKPLTKEFKFKPGDIINLTPARAYEMGEGKYDYLLIVEIDVAKDLISDDNYQTVVLATNAYEYNAGGDVSVEVAERDYEVVA